MYIFFDTETTGLPKNWKAPVTDTDNWPRVTQLAWQVYDKNGKLLNERCDLIKPDGWTIPTVEELRKEGNKNPHFFEENNMSTERCEREGVELSEILKDFVNKVNGNEYLIAHNMSFDEKIIGCEMVRQNMKFREEPKKVCTMQESTYYCKQKPFRFGKYKWPTLTELHNKLFNEGFDGAHDALADVKACAKSFFELKKRKIILKS
jgi:DNA polymerase III epsilon subunit-like protein